MKTNNLSDAASSFVQIAAAVEALRAQAEAEIYAATTQKELNQAQLSLLELAKVKAHLLGLIVHLLHLNSGGHFWHVASLNGANGCIFSAR